MPDDRPTDEEASWPREESLFGARPRTGEVPASPPPPGEVFSGPLFRRSDAGGGDPDQPGPDRLGRSPHAAAGDGPSLTGPADEREGAEAADGARTFPDGGRAPARSRSGASSFFRELPVLLLIAFVLAFLLRTFVLQVFYIPSSSMEPTLQINDRMAVEKVTYQFREPRRGEVVVFEGEELGVIDPDASFGERALQGVGQFLGVVPASARDLVKRVIGLPGDEILIEDGQVFVNGTPIDEPYVVFPDNASYGPVTVPDDSLFFLGDNRPNSNDSRRSLGMVPLDDVVGRAVVIIWPPGNAGSLTGVEHELPSDTE